MKLNHLNITDFLENYWQKAPLVIRAAFDEADWITPDELAGLACEAEVESRLMLQEKSRWKVEHGPFPEDRFAHLPESHWTLLVQAVDQWVPEVADILDYFRFLPSWRVDDVMVSYAPVGGTVSQHFDFYDVFLIQGEGQRVWQIGQVCDANTPLVPNQPVKILENFDIAMEVTLNPGDILYVPARYAHYGVSVKDSLTYSVGFRAPGVREMVDGICTRALETLADDQRYRDSALSLQAHHGEIPKDALEQVRTMLLSALDDPGLITEWLGRYVTERKYPELDLLESDSEDYQVRLAAGEVLIKQPGSRFAYVRKADVSTDENNSVSLFVNGESYPCSLSMAVMLCDAAYFDEGMLKVYLKELTQLRCLEKLIATGALIFEEDCY